MKGQSLNGYFEIKYETTKFSGYLNLLVEVQLLFVGNCLSIDDLVIVGLLDFGRILGASDQYQSKHELE